MSITRIITEVLIEIDRADVKHGRQLDTPDGTGMPWFGSRFADAHRANTEAAFAAGIGTWRHILTEEVAESYAESDPVLLRAELVQVAAVAVRWIDAIDYRTAAQDEQAALHAAALLEDEQSGIEPW